MSLHVENVVCSFLFQFYSHSVTLDMDKIVHTVSGPGRKFDCYVYQLDLRPQEICSRRKSQRRQIKKPEERTSVTGRLRNRRGRRSNTGFYNEDSDD